MTIGNSVNLVWHYAPWARLPKIVATGALKGSNTGASEERAMLWFSANQKWEPTATKNLRTKEGRLISLTFAQQEERFGCIRFGLSADDPRLLNWKESCAAAGTPREQRRALELSGKKRGANPADWFATVIDISLAELRFQIWVEKRWSDALSPKAMADVWVEAHANLTSS